MGKPKIGIVDVPFHKGQPKGGVQKGPKAMRDANLLHKLREAFKADVKDYGIIKYDMKKHHKEKCPTCVDKQTPDVSNYDDVVQCNRQLSKVVEEIIGDGRTCLTLGGDHSIGLGAISGHCKAKDGKISIIWVDAHADINTDATSGSGNMHGMALALLAKEIQKYWRVPPMLDWYEPCISVQNIAYIGLRSIDPYEEFMINKLGIACYDMEDVQNLGIHTVLTSALKKIDPHNNRSLHLSFDIDAIDPHFAGSTGTPVSGGLLVREGIYIANALHNTGRLGGIDMVEINPEIGTEDLQQKTVDTAVEIIMAAFGSRKRGFPSGLPPLDD